MCSFSAGFGLTISSFEARSGAAMARATAPMRSADSGCPLPGSCFRKSSLTMTPVGIARLAPRPIAAEEKGRVGSAEAERVRESVLHSTASGHVRDVVEVALRVRSLVVHGGGQFLVSEREDGDPRFEPPRPAQKMAGHGFRGAHRDFAGVIAEDSLDRQGLGAIVVLRRSPVGVDIVDLLGPYAPVRD